VNDAFVAQVHLDGPSVLAGIGEVKTASVPELVRMDGKLDTRSFAGFSHDMVNRAPCDRSTAQ